MNIDREKQVTNNVSIIYTIVLISEHFSQIRWCFYFRGNVLGSLPFETGNPCTLCDIGERCIDNLCVSKCIVYIEHQCQ